MRPDRERIPESWRGNVAKMQRRDVMVSGANPVREGGAEEW